MLLNTYQNNIVSIIQKYVDNGYIMSFNFSVDTKSNYIGFIQGSLEFLQGSQLFLENMSIYKNPLKNYPTHFIIKINIII